MKYMLIMNTPRDGYSQYLHWPKETLEANIAFMREFTRKLSESGELVSAEGLAAPSEAVRIRADKDGALVLDGAFPATKEYLAGYWIVNVESAERAYEIAAVASTAPSAPVKGPDGRVIKHHWIEVREVMTGAPTD